MATGLLVVFLGRATRAVEFAEADEKCYEAGLRLGITTDTQDTSGTVLMRASVCVTEEALSAALEQFRGEIDQIPPMYSAIKIDGKRLYDLARKGREVERKARRITIFDLHQRGKSENGDILLTVRCSKGTYIRTLCHDIGAALGCGGTMSALRRTHAGIFSVAQAHCLDAVLSAAEQGTAEQLLLPVDSLFSAFPALTLSAAQEKVIRNGGSYTFRGAAGTMRLYGADGSFLALGSAENGIMRSIKSFYEV